MSVTVDLHTTSDAARLIGRTKSWVIKECERGNLACLRTPSGLRLIPRRAIEDYIRRREERNSAGLIAR